jgi:DNA mismatch repair protein MSH6
LAQIHAFGNKDLSKNHPNSQAILYEMSTYSKKKISDFVATFNGFEAIQRLPKLFSGCSSRFLKSLTHLKPDGNSLDMTEKIEYFKGAFNMSQALKTGFIIPESGVDEDCDRIMEIIEEINAEMKAYSKEQEKFFGDKLAYFGNDKK